MFRFEGSSKEFLPTLCLDIPSRMGEGVRGQEVYLPPGSSSFTSCSDFTPLWSSSATHLQRQGAAGVGELSDTGTQTRGCGLQLCWEQRVTLRKVISFCMRGLTKWPWSPSKHNLRCRNSETSSLRIQNPWCKAALSSMVTTDHMWLLSTWYVVHPICAVRIKYTLDFKDIIPTMWIPIGDMVLIDV